jgi:hypothetical protein
MFGAFHLRWRPQRLRERDMPPREIRDVFIPPRLQTKLLAKSPPIAEEDLREVLANARSIQRGPRNSDPSQRGRCYFVQAQTDAGRTLKILLRLLPEGFAFVITAWDPDS